MKRKICIFTGTRAEYGLLKPLMEEIKKDKRLRLQVLVTGMHLSREFGLTYKEIEGDGFKIDKKVRILSNKDTKEAINRAVGLAFIRFSKAYEAMKPDIVIVRGDRFETFAAAASAMISGIPVAHIAGGEVTVGAMDEAFRHSITKMSHIHFTVKDEYRKRVIQLGENPRSVYNVGAIGLDNIKNIKLLTKKDLEKELNFRFAKKNLLVTFHPVTLENNTSGGQFQNLLDELNRLQDTHIIFTKANADMNGRVINRMIDKYVRKNFHKARAFASMGHLKYLSAMKLMDAVVGNSSSGIAEAPIFKTATINIGDRQLGRIKPKSVIDCKPTKNSIREAFKKLYSSEFQRSLKNTINPYGPGKSASHKVKTLLKDYDLSGIIKKTFYDIKFNGKNL